MEGSFVAGGVGAEVGCAATTTCDLDMYSYKHLTLVIVESCCWECDSAAMD